jgi:hypothetical protein
LLSHHHNAGQNGIIIGNRPFENVAQLRYLGITVTNQYLIQNENRRKLDAGKTF